MYILKVLKQDMEFSSELSQIIDIYKNIASGEFMRMQSATEKSQDELLLVLGQIARNIPWHEYQDLLLLREDPNLPTAFVVLGADEGFSGGLNTQVMTVLLESRTRKQDEFLVLGERAAKYLEEMRETFLYFGGIFQEITYQRSEALVNFLWGQFRRKKWGRVCFVYPHFISVSQQEVRVLTVLPYKPDFKISQDESQAQMPRELLLEPSAARIIDYFIRFKLILKVQEIFYSTKLSEYAARIVHLEGSSHQINEWQRSLRLDYFKGIHELRDRRIREIFASTIEE